MTLRMSERITANHTIPLLQSAITEALTAAVAIWRATRTNALQGRKSNILRITLQGRSLLCPTPFHPEAITQAEVCARNAPLPPPVLHVNFDDGRLRTQSSPPASLSTEAGPGFPLTRDVAAVRMSPEAGDKGPTKAPPQASGEPVRLSGRKHSQKWLPSTSAFVRLSPALVLRVSHGPAGHPQGPDLEMGQQTPSTVAATTLNLQGNVDPSHLQIAGRGNHRRGTPTEMLSVLSLLCPQDFRPRRGKSGHWPLFPQPSHSLSHLLDVHSLEAEELSPQRRLLHLRRHFRRLPPLPHPHALPEVPCLHSRRQALLLPGHAIWNKHRPSHLFPDRVRGSQIPPQHRYFSLGLHRRLAPVERIRREPLHFTRQLQSTSFRSWASPST